MPLREREQFERVDVPEPSALRTTVSIAVLVVTAIVCLILLRVSWHKANQMNGLNDGDLYSALYDQGDVEPPSPGRAWSQDDFNNCLVLTVDDVHAEAPEIRGAYIVARNMTQKTATIVDLPLNTRVLADDSTTYLPAIFAAKGAVGTLAPLTDTVNIHVSHVIVANEQVWASLQRLSGPTAKTLLSSQTNILDTMQTDMATGELVAFAEWLQAVGNVEELPHHEPLSYDETLPDGTAIKNIDRQQLPLDLGIYVLVEG